VHGALEHWAAAGYPDQATSSFTRPPPLDWRSVATQGRGDGTASRLPLDEVGRRWQRASSRWAAADEESSRRSSLGLGQGGRGNRILAPLVLGAWPGGRGGGREYGVASRGLTRGSGTQTMLPIWVNFLRAAK